MLEYSGGTEKLTYFGRKEPYLRKVKESQGSHHQRPNMGADLYSFGTGDSRKCLKLEFNMIRFFSLQRSLVCAWNMTDREESLETVKPAKKKKIAFPPYFFIQKNFKNQIGTLWNR